MTLPPDVDLLDWLRAEFADWRGEVNSMLRSFHDTAFNREAVFDPSELIEDSPSLIDLEFA